MEEFIHRVLVRIALVACLPFRVRKLALYLHIRILTLYYNRSLKNYFRWYIVDEQKIKQLGQEIANEGRVERKLARAKDLTKMLSSMQERDSDFNEVKEMYIEKMNLIVKTLSEKV